MPLFETLATTLGPTVAKLLLKKYVGETVADLAGPLADHASKSIASDLERRKAEGIVRDVADQITEELRAYFEREKVTEARAGMIADAIAQTLASQPVATTFLAQDLDPKKITAEVDARPVPDGLDPGELTYYRTALRGTVTFLVGTAEKLPSFEVANVAESLRRFRRLAENTEGIKADTREILRHMEDLQQDRADERQRAEKRVEDYEARYRQAVTENLDYVELLGFGHQIRRETKELPLSVAYITLNLQLEGQGRDAGMPVTFPTLLNTMLATGGRLLILGEAGSGKTTLLRWAATAAASSNLAAPDVAPADFARAIRDRHELKELDLPSVDRVLQRLSDRDPDPRMLLAEFRKLGPKFAAVFADVIGSSWQGRVPFMIRLRNCQDGRLPPPEDFPRLIANELGDPPEDWVGSVLEKRRGLILLDGIDEIPNVRRDDAKRAMEALMRAYEETTSPSRRGRRRWTRVGSRASTSSALGSHP